MTEERKMPALGRRFRSALRSFESESGDKHEMGPSMSFDMAKDELVNSVLSIQREAWNAALEAAAEKCDEVNSESGGGFEAFAEVVRSLRKE